MAQRNGIRPSAWALVAAALVVAGCAQVPTAPAPTPTPSPAPEVAAPPAPAAQPFTQRGRVSLYGDEFAGRKTASGAIFDPQALTMAHRTLPFGTRVRVTNLENQRNVEVVVNDRGPAVPGRIADLSAGAASKLGMMTRGVVEALLEVVSKAQGN